jgi:hypothetical protein
VLNGGRGSSKHKASAGRITHTHTLWPETVVAPFFETHSKRGDTLARDRATSIGRLLAAPGKRFCQNKHWQGIGFPHHFISRFNGCSACPPAVIVFKLQVHAYCQLLLQQHRPRSAKVHSFQPKDSPSLHSAVVMPTTGVMWCKILQAQQALRAKFHQQCCAP